MLLLRYSLAHSSCTTPHMHVKSCAFPVCTMKSFSKISRNHSTRATKLLFPGQGAQYVGMTSKLHPLCSSAEEIFSVSSTVLGYDLKKLCLNGPEDVLRHTVHCQPAIVVSSLVALEQLKHKETTVRDNRKNQVQLNKRGCG